MRRFILAIAVLAIAVTVFVPTTAVSSHDKVLSGSPKSLPNDQFRRYDVPGNGAADTMGQSRTLTFSERVAFQRAIEDVYWSHRIWPKESRLPRPSLDAVLSRAQLENKVAGYLHDSQTLDEHLHEPITAEQLQGEMDRIAQHTKRPEVLQELFDALGNDPAVIAEVLARPVLTERLIANLPAGERTGSLGSPRTGEPPTISAVNTLGQVAYTLPKIARTGDPLLTGNSGADTNQPQAAPVARIYGNAWTATSSTNAPYAREGQTAVWTGSEMIVWGGGGSNTGGKYDLITDSWTPTSTTNAPVGRSGHTVVWTGVRMIVWGGESNVGSRLNTGGRYDPATNSWTATSTENAPEARTGHTAVWLRSEGYGGYMIVWGGTGASGNPLNTGCRYDPTTDSWTATSVINAPEGRTGHTAIYTGGSIIGSGDMVVWGGSNGSTRLNSGGKYHVDTNSWLATNLANAPDGRAGHTAVMTPSGMVVWGGEDNGGSRLNTGGTYASASDTWTPTSTTNAPAGRTGHTAVSTDSEMVVWGGSNAGGFLNTGGGYDPETDIWTTTRTASAPDGRTEHTAVSTGGGMIVWGGHNAGGYLNMGGRYLAQGGNPAPVGATLRLRGKESFSPSGRQIIRYEWSVEQPAGSSSAFYPTHLTADPTFPVTVAGTYTFHLNVWDEDNVQSATPATYSVEVIVYDNYLTIGPSENPQITIGTAGRDMIVQNAGAGGYVQYNAGASGDDWLEQYGGAGNDQQAAQGGFGSDFIFQQGGEGNNTMSVDGGDGSDRIVQIGGPGDDSLTALGGFGDNFVIAEGGPGNDVIYVNAGEWKGPNVARILGGPGNDTITYIVNPADDVLIDGGSGYDALTMNGGVRIFTIFDQQGNVIFSTGPGGTRIRLKCIEHVTVLGGSSGGEILFDSELTSPSFTLTVDRSGTGLGTVTSSPSGINCGANCVRTCDCGEEVTLTATPSSGSAFRGWWGGGCGEITPCVVAMNADQIVTATFALTPTPTPTATPTPTPTQCDPEFTLIGTDGDDTQILLGTTGDDHICQYGYGGNDTQYATGADGNDTILQDGGDGNDGQTARLGTGNDQVTQSGGAGNDSQYAEGGSGNDQVVQSGGAGNDTLGGTVSDGNDSIAQDGGAGDDAIVADGGGGDDVISMAGGDGNDTLTYTVSDGLDTASIDGGPGTDSLIMSAGAQSLTLRDAGGHVLYTQGNGGSVIMVTELNGITVLGPDGTAIYHYGSTSVGSNVTIHATDASATFSTVLQAGTTIFTAIDPALAGTPPSGYTLCLTCPAFEITTTAIYTPPVEMRLAVPASIDDSTFMRLALLHGESGALIDRTTDRITEPGGKRWVCGAVSSLSPFVLAEMPAQTPTPTPTSTQTPTATPTTSPTPAGTEGDVAPRPDGDGIILATDVTQMRRFATGLDTPAISPNEFQRADSAPRTTLGDGLVSSGDVVQCRRYATGLDPLTPAGGPIEPPALPADVLEEISGGSEDFAGREVRVGKHEFAGSDRSTLIVPIEIWANGDEAAASFTVEYDPEKLSNPRVLLGDPVGEHAVLTVNYHGKGLIGILVDSDKAMVPSKMPKRLVVITFFVVGDIHAEPLLVFNKALASQSISDVFGNVLPAYWR